MKRTEINATRSFIMVLAASILLVAKDHAWAQLTKLNVG